MIQGKGNRREQQRRRRKNNNNTPILDDEYRLVDGNYSNRPVAYCCYHKGYLTNNQVVLHKCDIKNCNQYKSLKWKLEKEGDYID